MIIELESVCAESIGVYDVCARVKIVRMNCGDNLGVGDIPFFGMLARCQSLRLQQRAHTTVKINDMIL